MAISHTPIRDDLAEGTPSQTARRAGLRFSLNARIVPFFFSLAYGLVLQALPLMEFKDRANYLEYAQYSAVYLLQYVGGGPLTVFANEPLWLLINIGLAQLGSPEFIMRTVIFVGAARFSYVFLRADPKNAIWLMLFLAMPQLLKNFITHLRQGLALAIFFTGYFATGPVRRWTMMLMAPMVHASYLFILPIIAVPDLLRRLRLDIDIRLLTIAGYALAVSLSLGLLAGLVGARQSGQYDFVMTEVSGLGFVYWTTIFGVFLIEGKSFLKQHQEAIGVLIFYLLSYFLIEVTSRIFESGMPLVLLAGLALRSWRRWVFIGSFLLYSTVQLILRLSTASAF